MVRHATTGEVYHHTPVPANAAIAIVNECAEHGLHLNYCLNDELYVAEQNAWSDLYEARTGVPATPIGDLRELAGETPTKLLIIHTSEKLQPLLRKFQTDYAQKLYVTQTQAEYIEFMNPVVTKGRALTALAKRFDIAMDTVVAFGDSYNDESLLKTAGFGIAMANAVPPIRDCADYITTTNDENGVAKSDLGYYSLMLAPSFDYRRLCSQNLINLLMRRAISSCSCRGTSCKENRRQEYKSSLPASSSS